MTSCALLQQLDPWQNGSLLNTSFLDATNVTSRPPSILFLKKLTYGYIAPIIITFGLFGDLMTMFILTHPLLRKGNVIYMYLTFLAVTDLFTQLSVIPMILWLLDFKLCSKLAATYYAHVGFPLANAFMGASVWIVVFLTLSQYVAICHPFKGTFKSKKMSFYLTCVSYAVSFIIYVPWGWKKAVYQIPWQTTCPYIACDNPEIQNSHWFGVYQWIREAISRFIPFLFIAYFNIRILIAYHRTKQDRMNCISESQKETLAERSEQEEKRLWYLLVSIMSLFFVCTIPAAPLTILVTDQWAKNLTFQIFRAVTNILEFTKFALNFYFYCMINPDIRGLFMDKIFCQEMVQPAMVGSRNVTGLANRRSRSADSKQAKLRKHQTLEETKSDSEKHLQERARKTKSKSLPATRSLVSKKYDRNSRDLITSGNGSHVIEEDDTML